MTPLRFVVPALGFIVTLAAWYPGDMRDPDVIDQFRQSLAFDFNDWHPPAMAVLWAVLNRVWQGPQPLLVLQLGLFWAAVGFLLSGIAGSLPPARQWAVAAMLCLPAVGGIVAPIEKDVQLCVAWTFAAAFVFWRRSIGRPPGAVTTLLVLLVVLYGALVRHNAALAAGPLVVFVLTGRPVTRRAWHTVAVYAAVALTALTASQVFNAALRVRHTAVVRALLTFDLAGISTRLDRNELPFALSSDEFARVESCYDGTTQDVYVWYGRCGFLWPAIDRETDRVVVSAWARAVVRDPAVYVAHRATVFWHFVVKRPGETWAHFAVSLFARPLPYALWLIAAAGWVVRRNETDAFVRTELIMAAMYFATYIPLAGASGFRYVFLVVTALVCGTAVALARQWAGVRPRIRTPVRGRTPA